MVLFCIAIRWGSVSFLIFSLYFPCPGLLVCYLASLLQEVSLQLFFSPFRLHSFNVFSGWLYVAIVPSACISSFFTLFIAFFESLYWCITIIFTSGVSSSFFWDIIYLCHLSMSSFKSLCIVINVFVFLFFCVNFSLIHFPFTNGPEYLIRGTAPLLITLMRFLLQSLISRSYLLFLGYSFLILFSFISIISWHNVWWWSLPILPSNSNFPSL